jgi:D-glycero-alpha-D-manno-heptose 1-phosphate guanylyltransferase
MPTPESTFDLSFLPAAVLAGGRGHRLRSAVSDRPKVLAEVGGRPFLSFILDQLAAAGVQYVVLCTGYLGHMVERTFGHRYKTMELDYSREDTPLDTGGALRRAVEMIDADHVIAMNGDSYADTDLSGFGRWFFSARRNAGILLTRVADSSRYGQVRLTDTGRIVGFEEKATRSGPGWINAGVYLMQTGCLNACGLGRRCSLERDVFPALVGTALYGYRDRCRFIDIGLPAAYRRAAAFFTTIKQSDEP